ncbi:hypothetical protein [Nocardia crassostreae]|nr:hypothetical protein [Nocardia crassostreae]
MNPSDKGNQPQEQQGTKPGNQDNGDKGDQVHPGPPWKTGQ